MGLRCLFGHDFGEAETTREREERGDEVVVTVREYEECVRCGRRRVVSESTEVSARPSPDAGGDPEPAAPDAAGEADAGGSDYDDVSAAEDDGVILEDDPGDGPDGGERAPGEWPATEEAEDVGEVEHGDWPHAGGEDEGFDAEPDDGEPAEDVEFRRGGLEPEAAAPDTPEEATAEPDDEETVEPAAGPSGIRSAASGPEPAGGGLAGIETEFVCPECDFSAPTARSSLRRGDICPECRRGYLTERERPE